ncbi:uncharacterized protein ACA1_247710 [Acanthamoeba castellanii str. Neff]|uniref:Uncharacterized protein n=1 Tax=Acanthamoeba castellanii (strain ATCC 30010 / Neff) TaxID=1257118 RepID=L8GLG1_ACACF|nr:uncharacterized protein ACA1_247710 [Acanthamoeba castellanii str. Neff]ELR13543.1 hypothetical protein ACA1_247710 [Acanthamoeba castellanii str. Neff]
MHGYCYNDKRSPPQRGYGYLFTYVRYWDMQQRGGHGLCGGFILKKKPSDGGGTSKKINRWGNCEGEPLRIARFTYNQQNYFDLYAFFDDRPAPVLGFWRKQPGKGAELVAGVDQDGVRHAWGTHINAWARPGHDWTLLGANYVSFSLEVCLAQSTCEEVLAINVEKQENDQGLVDEITVSTHEVNNQSDDPLQRTVSEAVSLRNTATIKWEGGVKIGGEATIKAKVPFFVDGHIKSTLKLHASHSREYTNETIRTLTLVDATTVKPWRAKRCDHTIVGTLTTRDVFGAYAHFCSAHHFESSFGKFLKKYNAYGDPEALAQVVLSGVDVVLVPLDATGRLIITQDYLNRIEANLRTPEACWVNALLLVLQQQMGPPLGPHAAAMLVDQDHYIADIATVPITIVTQAINASEAGRTMPNLQGTLLQVVLSANDVIFDDLFAYYNAQMGRSRCHICH